METRERILRSAWKLLEANDGSGVRMSDIAKDAGVSRQAVYLHFPTRSELLITTTRYLDVVYKVDDALVASRTATRGVDRLHNFIDALGGHIPKIYGVARALMAMQETDSEAKAAMTDRTQAMRHGCEAAVQALKKDNMLSEAHPPKQATDILWMLLSIRSWEHLTQDCGWPQKRYIEKTKEMATQILVKG